MQPDQSSQRPEEEKTGIEASAQHSLQPIYFLPFNVQLQNAFFIEIIAKRFPVNVESTPVARLGLENAQIDAENLLAQVTLYVQVAFEEEPHPFDISFKLLGQFSYTQGYKAEYVRMFLEQGSLSILLPFARELLASLCTRLQVPPIMLAMVQLAPHPSIDKSSNEEALQ